MSCKHYQREIEHIEFTQKLSEETESHIESCASCQTFKSEHDSLRYMIGDLEKVAAPANFDTRLRARLAQSKQQRPNGFIFLQANLLRPALSVSLVLALILVGFLLIRPFTFSNQNQTLNGLTDLPFPNSDWIDEDDFPQQKEIIQNDKDKEVAKDKVRFVDLNTKQNVKPRRETILHNEIGQNPAGNGQLPFGIDNEASITIPVRTGSRSLVINDKRVALRSVTFGSQAIIEGNHPVRSIYASNTERVW